MDPYSNYIEYIQTITSDNIINSSFKSNSNYTQILEHVSQQYGQEYLEYIMTEFPEIPIEKIREFVYINDLIGNPIKYKYNDDLICSPTNLRYIYHALVILKHYQAKSCNSIVEIGCGYGGLFLAISFFAKFLKINIVKYYIIDLNEVGQLISLYLQCHQHITLPYEIHNASSFGSTVNGCNLYVISNYCFTEIMEEYRFSYAKNLFNKVIHGFITWQTSEVSLENFKKYFKNVTYRIIEEKPQTSFNHNFSRNYFVYF